VKHGATTIWERWDGWTPEHGFQSPKMNSFNHYSLGSCEEWIYDTLGGIDLDPEIPGFKHAIVHPTPGGTIQEAETTYDSINGKIATNWKVKGTTFNLRVTVPINTTATIVLPRGCVPASLREGGKPLPARGLDLPGMPGQSGVEVGSGDYDFTCTIASASGG
jgi:alpha-L-rhamnosidase